MLCSIFLEMSLDFATLTSVKKVQNLQHENLPIQDINFPTKNSKSPDLGSRMYHMYAYDGLETPMLHTKFRENQPAGSGEEDIRSFFFTIYGRGGHLGHMTHMP